MIFLVIGLILFLGIHSIRIFAEPRRGALIERFGEGGYKGIYTLLSFAGLILIIYGYGQTRLNPVNVWYPAGGLNGVTIILTWIAFILLASNEPSPEKNSHIKNLVGHPMVLGVKVWAFAHLLVNGRLGDIVLFGSFLAWAILSYSSNRRRDRANAAKGITPVPVTGWGRDIAAIVGGTVVWLVIAIWLHPWLIGIKVIGG